jgi:tetratricopeptide (TPR) repeat protein
MRNVLKAVACLMLLCLTTPLVFARKEVEPKDQAEAIKWVQEQLKDWRVADSKVTLLQVEWVTAKGYRAVVPLARISKISYYLDRRKNGACDWRVDFQDYAADGPVGYCVGAGSGKKFAAALDFLSAAARQQVKAEYAKQYQNFEAQAKIWREAVTKPTMPESAREHQVLAEYAFKEKNADKAIMEYAAALAIFPTWPEGQFNLATLAGEKKYYEMAILHMKEYLELAPDSADIQASKDSIIVWRDKLSTFLADANDGGAGSPTLQNTSAKPRW